jgi:hypothetical protein
MRIFPPVVLAMAAFFAAGQAALATPPPGTQLTGTIVQTLNTGSAYVGEPVQITNVSAPGAHIYGATMSGRVTNVVRAGQGRAAKLRIAFDRLTLRSGEHYTVAGVVTGLSTNTKNNTVKEAAGTIGGMIVGNIVGKTIFHSGGGGLLGAAGGFLLAKNNRQNMTVPAGTAVTVRLASASRQAGY